MGAQSSSCGCLEGVLGAASRSPKAPGDGAPVKQPPGDKAGASAGGDEGPVLSKKQQKKQVHRDAREAKRGQKKVQKQADALEGALAALDAALPAAEAPPPPPPAPAAGGARSTSAAHRKALRGRLRTVFGVAGGGYRELPAAHGPTPSAGIEAVGSIVVRPPRYSAKFLPQEYSLLHKVWSLLGGDCVGAGVLDIGAGNACCAVLAATMLGLTVVCVERESPRDELRAEVQLPPHLRQKVIRLESDVEDFSVDALCEVAAAHGLRRVVLMAKHPCGIGVDRSIDCAARLVSGAVRESSGVKAGNMPQLLGVILATCCTNKLSFDDNKVSRVVEFCEHYEGDVPGLADQAKLARVVELMSRCSAWRTAFSSFGSAISEEQLEWAELFEDCLTAMRLRRLQRLFGDSAEMRFAPRECTLQDRCLVASAPPLARGFWAHGEQAEDGAFLAQLRAAAAELLRGNGPIDCRPKGMKSSKYDFDYTDEAALAD